MKFVERIKEQISETKTKIAVSRDRKAVRDIVSRLSTFPLCSEDDAFFIVESEVTQYFGRHDCFALDLESNPSEEEKLVEYENLKVLRGQMEIFLEFLFDPSLQYSPSILKGSINARFHLKVMQYLDDTQMQIDETLYIEIIESMIRESSGADIATCFTNSLEDNPKLDLFTWFSDYREKFFPNLFFEKAGRIAQEKLDRHQELERISAPFNIEDGDENNSEDDLGNRPIKVALAMDAIGGGRTIKYLPIFETESIDIYVGQASVPRIIEYHSPFMLEKKHVLSLQNLSIGIKAEASLDWHFCEDGIIETQLDATMKPSWIPANKVKELVFGEGYDGLSKDGTTKFEHYYLYMIVRTSIGPTFTLYKYLANSSQKAMEAWTDLGEESFPAMSEYFNLKISDEVHDVSKHYKTTYTNYTTTWVWE